MKLIYIFFVYFEHGLRKETKILVEMNLIFQLFYCSKLLLLVILFAIHTRGWSRLNLTAVITFECEKTGIQKNIFLWKTNLFCHKRLLFTSKLAFYSFLEVFHATKWSKNLIFLSFLVHALASGATRPHLGVSEHPPNPHFQGLKIDLCGYCCPNYFFRPAPAHTHVCINWWFLFDQKIILLLTLNWTARQEDTWFLSLKSN